MSWELFDGPDFEEVYMVTGEWEVRVRQRKVRIRIIVDRNGKYHYQNSISAKDIGQRRIQSSPKGYSTQEEALKYAIKEISRFE